MSASSNLNLEYHYENESPRCRAVKDVQSILVSSGMTHKNLVATIPPHEGPAVRFLMLRELGGRLVSLTRVPARNAGLSSREVKQLLAQHAALRPLYLVIKAFLSQRALTSAQDVNGMSPYGLLKLCVRFLQSNPCSRPVHVLQSPTGSLGILLLDFFYYFGFRNIKAVKEVMEKFCTRDQGQRPSKKRRTNGNILTAEIEKHFKAAWNYLHTRTPIDTNILGPIVAIDQEMINRRTAVIELAPIVGRDNGLLMLREKALAPSADGKDVYLEFAMLDGK
ncbi:hypothetical protein H1R20_g10373, partial [Candolleomyces eurysporus]